MNYRRMSEGARGWEPAERLELWLQGYGRAVSVAKATGVRDRPGARGELAAGAGTGKILR